jgi:succinyl-CoA synthetase beta subunit
VILYEHQAKSLLAEYGVPVPAAGLYPEFPGSPSEATPLVAKAQILEGHRGQRGGIRVVRSQFELEAAVADLRAGSDLLPPAGSILVERMVPGRREIYIALMVDRDAGHPVLLVGQSGGVDVEAHSASVARFPLSIAAEQMPAEAIHGAGNALGSGPNAELERLLGGLWACFRAEECLLLEINPCVEMQDGALIPVDAKITIDDNARNRRFRDQGSAGRTRFEAECAEAGGSATELMGNIAIIVSGAGLAMATLDVVAKLGGQVRCVIDLGYSTLQSEPRLRRMLELIYELGCRVVLVNGFLQMASCAPLARAAVSVAQAHPDGPGVVARLAGNEADTAQAAVAEAGGHVAHAVVEACQTAVKLATADRRS